MFHRFSGSARSVVFRARDIAQSDGRRFIEPDHILLALLELHPELFKRLSNSPIDLQSVQSELAQSKTPSPTSTRYGKLAYSEGCIRVLQNATQQARSCWKQWEAPRRRYRQVLPEDLNYWEVRLKQPLRQARFSGFLASWLLRRTWEVDERHLLLGLLNEAGYPGVAILSKQGVTLEAAQQRLCATGG